MSGADWLVGGLVTAVVVINVVVFRTAFGIGDRKRDREELRRSARRAEPDA